MYAIALADVLSDIDDASTLAASTFLTMADAPLGKLSLSSFDGLA